MTRQQYRYIYRLARVAQGRSNHHISTVSKREILRAGGTLADIAPIRYLQQRLWTGSDGLGAWSIMDRASRVMHRAQFAERLFHRYAERAA